MLHILTVNRDMWVAWTKYVQCNKTARSPREATKWYARTNRNRPCVCRTKWCQSTIIQTFMVHQKRWWCWCNLHSSPAGHEIGMVGLTWEIVIRQGRRVQRWCKGKTSVTRWSFPSEQMPWWTVNSWKWTGHEAGAQAGKVEPSPSTRRSTDAAWYSCGKEIIEYLA
jgi:hypothetical protein